ncbi:MAG: PAS domain S-box protein [Gemmatimonadaceae bacterium]
MNPETRRRLNLSHERRVFLLALSAGLPGVITSLVLLSVGGYSPKVVWTFGVLVAGIWLVIAFTLRERVVRPLQTLSNMLAALREGDFSLRARLGHSDDALGLALMEINLLGDTLRHQRLGAMEATALLRAVMQEIDVAIFAFDGDSTLRLANRAGERLLAQPSERLTGRDADVLGLAEYLEGVVPRVSDRTFPERSGRWEVRRTTFRQDGRPHTLLVVTDVTRALREEELQAWQRLVRVLSHEINNSLAPIKSLAGSLAGILERNGASHADDSDDLRRGLGVIGSRADALSRFMSAYARLARLPAPRRRPVDVAAWVKRVAALETRLPIRVAPGAEVTVAADPDQLEQALINLLRERRGCRTGDAGRRERHLDRGPGTRRRHRDRRRAGHRWKHEPLCAVLHHEARRHRHRAGTLAPDRRSARREAFAGQPRRPPRRGGHASHSSLGLATAARDASNGGGARAACAAQRDAGGTSPFARQ